MNPDEYYHYKNAIGIDAPYNNPKPVSMQTYADVKKRSQLEQFDIYHREKMEAALKTLGILLTKEEVEDMLRRMDRECNNQERRLRNLQQAQRAMDELRDKIGFQESTFWEFDSGKIIRTPMGDFWIALRGLLEEFWTS